MSNRDFPAPFNNPAADIIVRSRDGVNFRVRSGIVAEASPIFADMFTVPLPNPDDPNNTPDYMDGKPVVVVEEDGLTLERLLRLCYPVADPVLTKVTDIRHVLAAAIKYEMEEAIALMKRALLAFLPTCPLAVWAAACSLRLADETMLAAKSLLSEDLPAEAPPELQEVTAGAYFRLVKYHRAGGNVDERFSFFDPDLSDIPIPPKPTRSSQLRIAYQTRPFADIICRSSSKEEFHTHRIILSTASPLLLQRILALHSKPAASDLPVIDLDFSSATLGAVLELCYPTQHRSLHNLALSDALDMLDCARRLQMDALFHTLRFQALASITGSSSRPLATYLLAYHYDLPDIAKDALGFLQNDPYTLGHIPEMEVTSAVPYHHLLVNRRESLAMASRMTRSVEEDAVDNSAKTQSETESRPPTSGEDPLPPAGDPWLLGMLKRTAESLHSPDQTTRWWERPDTSKTLAESVKRNLWCGPCEENVRLILKIEKLYLDVRKAIDMNNYKLKVKKLF